MEHTVTIKVTFQNGLAGQWPVREWRWTEHHPGEHPGMLILFHPLQPDLVQGSRVEIPYENILYLEVLISDGVPVEVDNGDS